LLWARALRTPKRWMPMLEMLRYQMRETDAETRAMLLQLARDPKYGIGSAALSTLAQTTPPDDAARAAVEELIKAELTGGDADYAPLLVLPLPPERLAEWPEAFALLFH